MTDIHSQLFGLEESGWTSESKEIRDDDGNLVTQITFTRGREKKRLTIGMAGLSIKAFWEDLDDGQP